MVRDGYARAGRQSVLVTPAAEASQWTHNLIEQEHIQRRLLELGVVIRPHRSLVQRGADQLEIACVFTGRTESIACGTLISVTSRSPVDGLFRELLRRQPAWAAAGIATVRRIGDADAPGTIAAAVYAGHRYARELGETIDPDVAPFLRERIALPADPST